MQISSASQSFTKKILKKVQLLLTITKTSMYKCESHFVIGKSQELFDIM